MPKAKVKKILRLVFSLVTAILAFYTIHSILFPITPRQAPPEFIKGIWMPVPISGFSFGFGRMVEDGINTFGTQFIYKYDEDGNLPRISEASLFNYASTWAFKFAKRKGLKTWLVLAAAQRMGEPQPLKANLLKDTNFLANYNQRVIEAAKIAEKYQIDFFTPYDEPDYRMCADWFWDGDEEVKNLCADWIKDIVPKIKEVYGGKILYKGALNIGLYDSEEGYDYSFIDVSDYDYLGVTVPMTSDDEAQKKMAETILDKADALVENTDIKVLLTEFGAWGDAIQMSEEDKVARETVILEGVEGRVGGICIGSYLEAGGSIKNTAQEELIKRQFLSER